MAYKNKRTVLGNMVVLTQDKPLSRALPYEWRDAGMYFDVPVPIMTVVPVPLCETKVLSKHFEVPYIKPGDNKYYVINLYDDDTEKSENIIVKADSPFTAVSSLVIVSFTNFESTAIEDPRLADIFRFRGAQ